MAGRTLWALGLGFFACGAPSVQAGGLREHVVFTLTGRLRAEWVDYFEPPAGSAPADAHRYTFGASQLRAGVRATFPHLQLVVEAQDTRLFGLPVDASLAAPRGNLGPGAIYYAHAQEASPGGTFLKQATVTLRRSGLAASVGRFEYSDGLETVPADPSLAWVKRTRVAERLIGPFGYTHVSRSFDGLRFSYDRARWNATALAVRPTRGGYDVRANSGIEDVGLAGLAFSFKPSLGPWPADLRAFYLYYDDDRPDTLKVDNRPAALRREDRGRVRVHTVGGHLATVLSGSSGSADLLLWSVAQIGDWGSLGHGAWALAAEAGWQFIRVPGTPWVRAGYDRSSGDPDPADGEHRTFFQVIPTPRIYAQFPFYNLMNCEDLFAQLVLRPHPRLQIRADLHRLRLVEPNDLWYSGGGATNDEVFGFSGVPSGGRRSLARVAEVSAAVRIHPRVGVYAYYSQALGQDVVKATFPGPNARYGYLELSFRY
jgi:hypothetical protein